MSERLTQQQLDAVLLPEYITQEQRAAIVSDGGSLLVSASAGSGKTFVLCTRVVYLLSHREKNIRPDQLLVVTFTRAAAKEMRRRIQSMFDQLLAQFPEDPKLRRQQLLLGRAKITTIDAFCSDLIREHFDRLDLSPDFTIGDGVLLEQLSSQLLDQMFEERYLTQDQDFLALSRYFSPKDDRKLHQAVLRLHQAMRTHPFPLAWLEENLASYAQRRPLEQTAWGKTLLQHACAVVESSLLLYQNGLQYLQSSAATFQALQPFHERVSTLLQTLLAELEQADWDKACLLLRQFAFPRKSGGKKAEGYDAALSAEEEKYFLKPAREQLQHLSKTVFSCSSAEYEQDRLAQLPYLQNLFALVREFYERFDRLKRGRNLLDFPDLGLYAVRLLVDQQRPLRRTDLGEEIAATLEEILVDEVQDINGLQDLLFSALSQDETNLFMVGDVKQSIYGFRQAEPALVVEKLSRYHDLKTGRYPARLLLAENFRSRAQVTHFVNYLFDQLMTPELGGLDYLGGEQLHCSSLYPPCDLAHAELHLLDLSQLGPDCTAAEQEAKQIARTIRRMIDTGYSVKGEDGSVRPCRPGDFAILLRSAKNKADQYAKALADLQLDGWTENASGYFQAREVTLMLNLLRVVDNPLQDVPLLSVMMSPLFGFTGDEMAQIRVIDRKLPLYRCVQQSELPRCGVFLSWLEKIRRDAAVLSVDKLIQMVYDQTLFYSLFGAQSSSEQKLANLRLLQNLSLIHI